MIIIAEGVEGVERDTASAYLICIPTSRGMWRRNGVRSFRTARIPRIRPFRDFVACSTTTLIIPAARSTDVVTIYPPVDTG